VVPIFHTSCFKQNKVINKKWTEKICSFHENTLQFDKVNIEKNPERKASSPAESMCHKVQFACS
jgi:hypothetical protein